MTIRWKRCLSILLAVIMVVGMVPATALQAFAAETDVPVVGSTVTTPNNVRPTAPDGYWYELDSTEGPNALGYSSVCGKSNHTHTDDCYTHNCDHKDGHLSTCYESSTEYTLCPDTSTHAHTGTANLSDVLTINGRTDVQWVTTHPAYPAVYAIYKAAYDATEPGRFTGDLPQKAAGVLALTGKTLCYTTTPGEEPICGHVCSETKDAEGNPGTCYEFATLCPKYEHTHKETDSTETSCYRYTWKLYADANDNQVGDGTTNDPYYTITYKGFGDVVLKEYQAVAGVNTPAYDGTAPARDFYTFKDWGTVATTVTGDATYTATWTPVKDEDGDGVADEEDNFVITWDNKEGTWADGSEDVVKTQTENYGAALTAPEVVAPTDHFFAGWSPAVDKVTKTVTYTAQYTEDTIYTVTYVVDGVTYVINGVEQKFEVNATDGDKVPSVAAPTKTDWLFTGWTNSDKIGQVPSADITLTATWVADKNNNGKSDSEETVTIQIAVAGEGKGTATLNNGGKDEHIIITDNGNGSYSVVYDSVNKNDTIYVTATANDGETTNVAYYLGSIAVNGTTITESFKAANGTVTVTFLKDLFELPAEPTDGWVIKINGFSNDTKAVNLKTLVLDAVLGKGLYTNDDYKVEMLTSYKIGSYDLGERYYNIEGETVNIPVLGNRDIPASWFVTQLVVDGETENSFRITKLASTNASGKDLYHDIKIVADEEREATENITMGKTDYTENTLEDVITAIKGNVLVNGVAANVTVTLTPEKALTTNKQTYTATVVAPGTKDYLESSKQFEITADINTYTVTWNPNNGEENIVQSNQPYGADIVAPTNPTKEGYSFAGWGEVAATVTGDVTYKAQWTINSYTVTWTINGEQYGGSSTIEYGAAVTAPSYTVPAGYTFSGWDVPATMPAKDITLNATQTPINYNVVWKYMTADGEQTITDPKPFGSNIVQPTIPLTYVSGNVTYTFAGWTGLTDGATVPVDGVTYTASYTTKTAWIVDFDTDGGSTVTSQTIIAENNETVSKPADPTKDGYRFDGWYTDKTFKTAYTFGETPSDNETVYAKWVKLVTVSFDVDGIASQTFDINGTATAPSAPDKEFAIFGGWYLNGSAYDFSTPVTAGITLTANWIEDKNDNNELDSSETVNVTVSVTGNGTVTLTGATDKVLVTDKGNGTWTVLYDSSVNGSSTVNITATPAETGLDSVKNYVDSSVETLDVTKSTTLSVVFKQHSIDDQGDKSMLVNGHVDKKVETVTKKAVLEAILGRTVTDAELAEYKVEMFVNLGTFGVITINGYYDIWELASKDYGETINAVIKSALVKAIDVGGKESFQVTWLAHDKYPEVTEIFDVTLTESREKTEVKHNGDTYTSGSLTDTLLGEIKNDLSANTTISQVVWGDNSLVDWENSKGSTVDVTLVVTVLETEAYYGTTHTIKVTVFVPYTEATVTIKDKADLTYNTGMTDADKANMVLSVVKPSVVPALPEGFSATVWYLASEARTVPYTINIAQLDLGIAGNFLPDTMTIQIPVEEMWLNIGDDLTIPEAPSNELIKKILLEDLIPNYAADYVAGNITSEQLKQIVADIFATYPEIEEYYRYLGAHQFGENEKTDADGNVQETVYVTVPDYGYGTAESNICVLTLADTRDESFIKLNEGVNVTYGKYTKEELLALLLNGVYDADGNKLDGVTVEFVTDVVGLPASEASEITVKFAGNEDYKPTTATATIVINRAPVTVAVDNQIVKWGTEYNKLPVTTDPANVDNIQFIVGLDVSNVNVDGGIKGILGNVQLLLPEELQDMLAMVDDLISDKLGTEVSFADGASMKLSELQAVVSSMDDLFAGTEYEEYFRVLLKMIESLPTETADVEIVIGGELPSNVGVYLIGAVTADSNYETAVGGGMLAIYPDGIKADIAWNQNDDNYVITNTLLTNGLFDAEAHATTVGAGGTLEEATAQIAEIFLGVNIDGEITLETDPSNLNVGAYVEVAMIANWGNQMYYSDPIARPFIVVAESLDVDFVDDNGKINNDRHFEFFNVPQNGMEGNLLITYKQDGDGYKAGDKVTADYTVKYYYVGVQTNGKPYASTTAPTHAGVYTITAVIVIRDNTGYITHAGQGIGALVIEPSKSTIDVENEAIKYDGSEHKINGFVDANSVNVPGLKPDTTIISAGIYADLDANTGLDAIKGNVNIDMPDWLDKVFNHLNVLEAGYADGISAETFLAYVEKMEASLVELGVETDAFDEIVSIIEQLPGKTTLTFHNDKGFTEVGAYLIIGVVTDSDHYPSVDAGIVVIYPDATKVDLQFNKTWDDNNVFTWNYLQNYDLNANAYDLNTDNLNAEATAKVTNLFVGFADDGRIILTTDKAELDNGVYEQVSFVLDLSNHPYYAEPISREIVIVPNPVEIDFVDENGDINNDRHFEFNNKPHAMDKIRVALVDGTELWLDSATEGVDIYYVGVLANGAPYASYDAPVHAGAYEVTVQYTTRDDQGRVVNLGVGVGVLVIEPSKSEITVDNATYPYGSEHKVNDLIHAESVNVPGLKPDITVISVGLSSNLDNLDGFTSINGTVNIDLPGWLDVALNKLNILEAGYADGISLEVFLNYTAQIREGLIELGVDTASFDEIVDLIEQMPITTNLTFKDNIGYSEVGAYLVLAVVTDSDHYPSVGAGIMVIHPDIDKAELNWNYNDANNIFTIPALNNIDMSASAYQDNVLNQEYTNKISYLTVGVTEDGRIVVTALPNSITSNGAYTQVAYIPTEVNSQITIAAPIMRNFIVVPQTADIEITNTKVTYGDKYQMPIIVKDMNGNVIEGARLGNLTVTYINLGTGYYSTVAPTEVGSYTVVAVYAEYDGDELAYYGIAVGNLTIVPADADYTLTDKDHACNTENSIDSMISNGNNLPYAIYVVTNVSKGEVNVILPAGWKITFQVGDTIEDLIAALEKLPAVIENTRIVEALKSVLSNIEMQTLTVNGEQPTEHGEYNVTAIAFGDKNYNLAKVSATLSIAHSYGEVTYSGDGKTSYTATRKCSCGDTQTATATISSEVTKEATCTETGVRTYTATFTEDWATGKTTTEDIAKKAHTDADGNHKCDDCGADMGSNNTPAIGIPSLTGDNVYGFNVDYANKILYIDAEKTGLTVEQFVDQLKTSVFNDSDNEAEVVVTYQGKVLSGIELIRTESQVSLIAENENDKVTVKYDVVVIGDVNRNGEVDSGDATLIQRYFFKEVELTELQADAADTNRSGEIESGDAVKNQVKYNDAANYQSNLHSYTQATSNGDATCEQDGTMTLVCTANHNCSAKSITVPEAGSAKGHTYVRKEEAYVCDDCKKIAVNI